MLDITSISGLVGNLSILLIIIAGNYTGDLYSCTLRHIINEYMSNIDDTIINNYYKDYNYNKCETCKINMSLDEIKGIMLCPQCGNTKDIIIMTEKCHISVTQILINQLIKILIIHIHITINKNTILIVFEIPMW